MRRWVLVLLALVPAACGGSSHSTTQEGGSTSGVASTSAATTARAPTTPKTGTAGLTTTTTPATTRPTATTPTSGLPLCTADALALSFLGQQGATGHGLLGFGLRNSSSHACHTYGFPGVLFLDRAGSPLPTQSQRVTDDLLGPVPERAIVLEPGQSASFRLVVTHDNGSPSAAGCSTAGAVQIIPPDDTHTLRATIPGGTYECTTVTVTPLQSGPGAYPAGT